MLLYYSFEPTYKELKQKFEPFEIPERVSFEPTYKELKQLPTSKAVIVFSSFEPTYKELKLLRKTFNGWKRYVLSLPIRNWNMKKLCQLNVFASSFEPTYKELKLLKMH